MFGLYKTKKSAHSRRIAPLLAAPPDANSTTALIRILISLVTSIWLYRQNMERMTELVYQCILTVFVEHPLAKQVGLIFTESGVFL